MVGGFVKAFKSEVWRILYSQHSDLDLSEVDKITAIDLAKVAKEEEEAKKSKRVQKKNVGPPSEFTIGPSQQRGPAPDSELLVENLTLDLVTDVPSNDPLPLETEA